MVFTNLFNPNIAIRDEFAVVYDNRILYSTVTLSNFEATALLMNLSVENNSFTHRGTNYRIIEEPSAQTPEHMVVRFVPAISPDIGSPITVFAFVMFLVVFVASSIVAQIRNYDNIIAPITSLKRRTDDIRQGDIDTAIPTSGFGELGDLADAIENLRVELKNSIYYRQKVDDNRKFIVSSISHDLKTPVTSIRGYIDGVLDGVADTNEKKEEYLKKAVLKIQHMNTMIDDLLLYSKLDLNQMPFSTCWIALNSYIEGVMNEYAIDFEKEGKRLFFEDTTQKEIYVKIDSEKMRRVVQNIFDNAKKHINEGEGWLKIILRESHAAVIVEFKDNGKGIKAKDMPHLFERFFRGDESRSTDASGGLGLAIAKQMIEGMNGRIWAVSKEGEGASFIISLRKYR